MMDEGKVKHKLRQVIFRHRKRFIANGLKRRPHNCCHNAEVKNPRRMGNKEIVRLCLYQVENLEEWNNVVCDSTQQAQECPHFQCRNKPDDLKRMFTTSLGLDGTPVEIGWIAKHYPDIAALTWVLGDVPTAETPKQKSRVLAMFGGADEPDTLPESPLETTDENG